MALNTAALQSAIKTALLTNLPTPISDQQTDQAATLADALTNALQAFVESATITYLAGLVAPDGPVTGIFTSTIS